MLMLHKFIKVSKELERKNWVNMKYYIKSANLVINIKILANFIEWGPASI